MIDLSFYKNKRIFLTGHTGFKGAWLSRILINAGATVTGYALQPPTNPSLWELLGMEKDMRSIIGDVRDFIGIQKAFNEAKPEIVIHMAAQPIVREGYRDPVGTYAVNVMGTAHLLECVRLSEGVKSVLNVTTDKVYENNEWPWGYRENDKLDGYDPYSNSKSCSELVTAGYARAFFNNSIALSTARAGNVIGGGDFAKDRIIPDCIRAMEKNEPVIIRNPHSIRPYQHVLEALGAYLLIVQNQYINPKTAGSYNVGPDDNDCVNTSALTDMFCKAWDADARWENHCDPNAPHEAGYLKLDCSKIKSVFNWKPTWDIKEAIRQTVAWEKFRVAFNDARHITNEQINNYFERM